MNSFDAVAGALLVIGIALGLLMGIVRAVISAVALATGGAVAVTFAPRCAEFLASLITSPRLALVVGFVLTYAVTLAGFGVVAWFLRRSLGALGLRWLDRALGAAVGVAVTLLFSSAFAYALIERVPNAPIVRGSVLAPALGGLANWLIRRAPEDVERRLHGVIGGKGGTDAPTRPER